MTTTEHPSNRLYDNDVEDFLEAMDLYRAQIERENALTIKQVSEWKLDFSKEDREFMGFLVEQSNKAWVAKEIYRTYIHRGEAKVIAKLRAKNDETFNEFADALEYGDYSGLAI